MTDYGEGQNARGVFGGSGRWAGQGRNFRRRRLSTIDHFAEELSKHDLGTGDLGGNVNACARRLGLKPGQGNSLLQRIRQRLGDQAR